MGSRTTRQEEHYTCNADTSDVADIYGVHGDYSVTNNYNGHKNICRKLKKSVIPLEAGWTDCLGERVHG